MDEKCEKLNQEDESCHGKHDFACLRENARAMLERRMDEYLRKANYLQTLLDGLPAVLSPEMDEALYELLLAKAN